MKAIEGCDVSTSHITPEDDFIYANFEAVGYYPKCVNLDELVCRILNSASKVLAKSWNGWFDSLPEVCLRTKDLDILDQYGNAVEEGREKKI